MIQKLRFTVYTQEPGNLGTQSCVDGSVIYSGPKGKAVHESLGGWVDKQAGSVYRNLPLPTEGRQLESDEKARRPHCSGN